MKKENQKKLNSIFKIKSYPFIEWRGEYEDCSFILRRYSDSISFGSGETELGALLNLKLYFLDYKFSLESVLKEFGLILPDDYIEFD